MTRCDDAPSAYTMDDAVTLSAPTRLGKVFTGWIGSNGTTAQTSVTIPRGSTGDRSYVATWRDAVGSAQDGFLPSTGGTDARAVIMALSGAACAAVSMAAALAAHRCRD